MSEYTKEKCPYFFFPKQIVFFDVDGTEDYNQPKYIAGIAYKDEIICGCCGGVFQIEDVWNDAIDAGVQPIFIYEDWIDMSEGITGDSDLTTCPVTPEVFFLQVDNYTTT